jgi:hypothetical protein
MHLIQTTRVPPRGPTRPFPEQGASHSLRTSDVGQCAGCSVQNAAPNTKHETLHAQNEETEVNIESLRG